MQLQKVQSSVIDSFGYESSTSTLGVVFKNKKIWFYTGVTEKVYQGLVDAESKGKYFNAEIKSVYSYFPLEGYEMLPEGTYTAVGELSSLVRG